MLARKALAGTAAAPKVYVEDVFSTYLYTGNGSTQTITNGIDLSGEGGLVWVKSRGIEDHTLSDTARGVQNFLRSNTTGAQSNSASALTAFNTDGFSVGNGAYINANAVNYASWTFRKAEKFFDVVTYTGNGTAGRTISHNLGSVPGVIIVKRTDTTSDWRVYHRSLGATYYLGLDSTAAAAQATTIWNDTEPTSTVFSVGSSANTNASGGTYVAYLFAHNAGGFGDAGDQSVIKCGSYTGNGSTTGPTIDLGWEPQWVLIKRTDTSAGWFLGDIMRGMSVGNGATGNFYYVSPNNSNAEDVLGNGSIDPTPTGFTADGTNTNINANGGTYIYIAIRRGPMKTPTTGTSVFDMLMDSGTAAQRTVTLTNTPDLIISRARSGSNPTIYGRQNWLDRLRGKNVFLESNTTGAENSSYTDINDFAANKGTIIGADQSWAAINYSSGYPYARYFFQRAPGFFDVVCYTGTGTARTVSHNLGVAPELMIVKRRNLDSSWYVWGGNMPMTNTMFLEQDSASGDNAPYFNDTAPTSSVFSVTSAANTSSATYVAYLFASVTGVSKVGSYTGNGSSQTINCGFTAGARFVLIKRTDSTGDWVVFDSARGIVSGNDPYLELNTTDAEVTDKDAVDTDNTGFVVNETTGPNVNTNSATYIYLAIA